MKLPALTVLMPVYNGEKYLREAVDSILNQTWQDFELIIVNDGSTDNTESIIRSYSDERIVLLNQSNKGVSNALNTGLNYAKADYVIRIDGDDVCTPQRFQTQYEFMIENPDYVLAGSEAEYIDKEGEFIFYHHCPAYKDSEIRQLPPEVCPFIHATVIFKKEAVLAAGGYDENAHTFEDHLLWTKILDYGKACNLNSALVKVRFNPESITIDERWRGDRFNSIKYNAIAARGISKKEGDEILDIIRSQNVSRIKVGAYHSLLAKKYLWNNFRPEKARRNAACIIKQSPFKADGYLLFALSFLPERLISKLYKIFKR